MSTWLYQLNAQDWSPETFRYEIWEGKPWRWGYGTKRGAAELEAGDTLIFFYAPTKCSDPGFYGWAVLERHREEDSLLYFTPTAPTNRLKLDPCWDEGTTKKLVDKIRGRMTQATLFLIEPTELRQLRAALRRHLRGA